MRVVACSAVPVLDWAMGKGICRQQLFHIGEFLIFAFYRLVVAFQADIESVSLEQARFLRCVRVMAIHTGSIFGNRGMFDLRCLLIADGLLVTFTAQSGDFGRQHKSLIGHVRRMAIQTPGGRGLVFESRIRKSGAHVLVTLQAHLFARYPQHSGNISAVRIVACDAGSDGKRPVDKATLELFFFVALEAQGFLRLHKPRKPSFDRDLMAKLTQILFCQQAIHL